MIRRTESSRANTLPAPAKENDVGVQGKKRDAISDKGKNAAVGAGERRPLAMAGTGQQAATAPLVRRARTAGPATTAGPSRDAATKRKATSTTTKLSVAAPPAAMPRSRSTTTSLDPLQELETNVDESEGESSRKRRKTTTPLESETAELVDEGLYDADGQELILSSGRKAGIAQRSPQRVKAKDDGWFDLDAEDEGDPSMVSEYVIEAFEYMRHLEVSRVILRRD